MCRFQKGWGQGAVERIFQDPRHGYCKQLQRWNQKELWGQNGQRRPPVRERQEKEGKTSPVLKWSKSGLSLLELEGGQEKSSQRVCCCWLCVDRGLQQAGWEAERWAQKLSSCDVVRAWTKVKRTVGIGRGVPNSREKRKITSMDISATQLYYF